MNPTSYASALTGAGYAALAIDHWCFGERATRTEGALFRETLWKGQVMWGLMTYDSLKAVDYLATRPDGRHGPPGHPGHEHGQHHGVVGGRTG